MTEDLFQKAYHCALSSLARAEHSQKALATKLSKKKFDRKLIDTVLSTLVSENKQSDARFAEQYVYFRSDRGYGPTRIRQELLEQDISENLIQTAFQTVQPNWQLLAVRVRTKKFGAVLPTNYPEKCRQMSFLQYRGFELREIEQACETEEQNF